MIPQDRHCRLSTALLPVLFLCVASLSAPAVASEQPAMPWREAGWTEREAVAHLLDRFSYGARPGEIDRVVEMGLERWLDLQLSAAASESDLERRLAPLDVWEMSASEIRETFPDPGRLRRMAMQAGQGEAPGPGDGDPRTDRRRREEMRRLMEEQGYRSQRELLGQLAVHKILAAVYAENQLSEVMTDFWFNHFNVSWRDNQARLWVLPYERDAIRPHVLGDFEMLLGATAKHPAMLQYLDNAASRAEEGRQTLLELETRSRSAGRGGGGSARPRRGSQQRPGNNRPSGLNENYARELMELHTLGVDGGYGQADVIEVARAFTGWMVVPPPDLERARAQLARAQRMGVGFVVDEGFLFNPEAHDAEAKRVLGQKLPGGRGMQDGTEVLALLAEHPSTARFLSHKLAVRFVRDEPPEALVERMARSFEKSGGDTSAVLRTMVDSPEFWGPDVRREKIKSPFELVVSSLRAVDAQIREPRALVQWMERLGQPLYAYEAPTGYPDRASAWVNTGALLNRMNFALQLASGQVPGVTLDLRALVQGREPESAYAALELYAPLLLPERDLSETLRQLEPMVTNESLVARVAEAAGDEAPSSVSVSSPTLRAKAAAETAQAVTGWSPEGTADPLMDDAMIFFPAGTPGRGRSRGRSRAVGAPDLSPVAQVVGLVLGSPEFQRR